MHLDHSTTIRKPANAAETHSHKAFKRRVASLSRWLHIYLSMGSFAILFFFAVTGLTLNHAEWFGAQPRTAQLKGNVEPQWIKVADTEVNKLAIVEYLRNTHAIKGALSDLRIEDSQISVSFKGPGYQADSFINRESGEYELTETRTGFVGIINDLHKGRDTGQVWSWMIDASAILMTLVSLTGIVLLWFIKRRRFSGFVLAIVAGVVCYAVYRLLVP